MVNGVDVVDDDDLRVSVFDVCSPPTVETSARVLFLGQKLSLFEFVVSN